MPFLTKIQDCGYSFLKNKKKLKEKILNITYNLYILVARIYISIIPTRLHNQVT